jgi:hypothetical protein
VACAGFWFRSRLVGKLVLNGGGCRAKFGGDFAVHKALPPQDEQPLKPTNRLRRQ